MPGAKPVGICLRGTPPIGLEHHSGPHPCPTDTRGRRLGLPRSGLGEAPSPALAGKAPQAQPGYQWAGAGAAGPMRSTPQRLRETCPARGNWGPVWGRWPRQAPSLSRPRASLGLAREAHVCTSPSAEARPRCGGALDGVKRLPQPLVPRPRQAPDGGQEGGSPPTESSRSTRRL